MNTVTEDIEKKIVRLRAELAKKAKSTEGLSSEAVLRISREIDRQVLKWLRIRKERKGSGR